MPEIVYYVAASVDGYIAAADGSVDWLARFDTAGEEHGAGELHSSVDALLLGSHTYEFALKLGHWPARDKPSWVFTHRDLRVLDPSITLTSQSPAELVAVLRARGVRRAANDTVISIVTASPFRTGQHGVEVAMSAKDLIQVAFASSRRKVLNIAKFSLSKS
ncbi:MAG: hypothetical protein H0X04_05655 [Chthoniobacterales bacterium]|nr:hypothetical protein [Chthoniobacterales bacterium]